MGVTVRLGPDSLGQPLMVPGPSSMDQQVLWEMDSWGPAVSGVAQGQH